MRILLAAVLAASAGFGCATNRSTGLSLQPVPYEMRVPERIRAHLETAPVQEPFAREAEEAGAISCTSVFYKPEAGARTILLTAWLFPEAAFAATVNPLEPPRFGRLVNRSGGMVLSVAGPHDTIFDPRSGDGQNVITVHKLLEKPDTFRRVSATSRPRGDLQY